MLGDGVRVLSSVFIITQSDTRNRVFNHINNNNIICRHLPIQSQQWKH